MKPTEWFPGTEMTEQPRYCSWRSRHAPGLGIELFSPRFKGNFATWFWICERSNGRQCVPPELNDQQISYALRAGYLTNEKAATAKAAGSVNEANSVVSQLN